MKDFYRLAILPPQVQTRWCVQLVSRRLRRYLDGVADRHGVRLGLDGGATTLLTRQSVDAVPRTARALLEPLATDDLVVRARCVQVLPVGDDLELLTHLVDAGRGSAPG